MKLKPTKKLLAGLASVILLVSGTTSVSAANSTEESFNIPPVPGNQGGYMGLSNLPSFLNSFSNPHLLGKQVENDKLVDVHACKSMDDSACSKANYFQATAQFDFCKTATETNCIDEVTATKDDGTVLPVNLGNSFPGARQQDYVGNPSIGLPNGATTHLISIPGAKHASGDLYLPIVNPQLTLDKYRNSDTSFTGMMQIALFAVSIKNGNFQYGAHNDTLASYAGFDYRGNVGGDADRNNDCIMNDTTICAVPEAIPLDVTFKISVRVNFTLQSWFSGRLTEPNIAIKSIGNNSQLLSVSAKAVKVPAIARWIKKTDFTPEMTAFYAREPKPLGGQLEVGWGNGLSWLDIQAGDPNKWSLMRDTVQFDSHAMEEFLLWLPALGDRADAVQTMWSAKTINAYVDPCLVAPDSVIGFVSSNATQYIEGAPEFDATTQTLNYKVAAPHYEKDGSTVFKGSYDLAIKSSAARCLYHFTNAPIGATIEVLDNGGKSQVAVTSVNERDGWIYLRAAGFTFSNPTLKVKLTQDAPVQPAQTKAVAKKTTCVKGKISKVVTTATCPAGYKKK